MKLAIPSFIVKAPTVDNTVTKIWFRARVLAGFFSKSFFLRVVAAYVVVVTNEPVVVSISNTLSLFFVASAFYAKGADRAIAALAALPLDQEVNAKLFIVGRNDETKLRRFAGRLGVDDRVFFLGARMDVPDLLCAADLLIHPARNEAAGIVLLEAIC